MYLHIYACVINYNIFLTKSPGHQDCWLGIIVMCILRSGTNPCTYTDRARTVSAYIYLRIFLTHFPYFTTRRLSERILSDGRPGFAIRRKSRFRSRRTCLFHVGNRYTLEAQLSTIDPCVNSA